MNNNARFDRPTDTFELEVNVPRTIGILRDAADFTVEAVCVSYRDCSKVQYFVDHTEPSTSNTYPSQKLP